MNLEPMLIKSKITKLQKFILKKHAIAEIHKAVTILDSCMPTVRAGIRIILNQQSFMEKLVMRNMSTPVIILGIYISVEMVWNKTVQKL